MGHAGVSVATDGDKDGVEGSYVEIGPGKQYFQIDLNERFQIFAIVVWHYHAQARVYHDVLVQLSADQAFSGNVRTVFNNDYDNSSGFGVGRDKEYIDSHEGLLIDMLRANEHNGGIFLYPEDKFAGEPKPATKFPASQGHERDWLQAARGGVPTLSNFSNTGPFIELLMLGNVATRFTMDYLTKVDPVVIAREHEPIVTALDCGDADKAATLLRSHSTELVAYLSTQTIHEGDGLPIPRKQLGSSRRGSVEGPRKQSREKSQR